MINARYHLNRAIHLAFAAVVATTFLAGHQTAAAADDWSVPAPGTTGLSALPERPVPSMGEPLDYAKVLDTALARNNHFEKAEQRLEDIALSMMLNPEAAFAYVRDEIRTEPYQGHLRQPSAVMAARGGNDHDKAQMLASLFRFMGYDTRLVEAPMTDDMAEAIQINACRTAEQGDEQVWRLAALQSETMARVRGRAERSFSALRDTLPDTVLPGTALPDPVPNTAEPNHIWMQARIGRDWVDLDPALISNEFGAKPAVAGKTLTDPVAPHRVSFTIELETLVAGKLRRQDILTQRLSVPETAELPVTLFFGPEMDGISGGLNETLEGLTGQTPSMRAVMMISGRSVKSQPFATPGRVNQSTDLFQEEQTDTVTAMTLRIRSEVPGQTDSEEERVIFDLLSTKQREAVAKGDTPDSADIGEPQMGQRYPAALESIRQIVLGNGGLSPRLAALRISGMLLELPETLQQVSVGRPDPDAMVWYSWVASSSVAIASEELIRARPTTDGICVIANRPRVLISGTQILPDDGVITWLDWTIDDVGMAGMTSEPGAASAARLLRVWHGALQSGLETEAILTQNAAPSGAIPPEEGKLIPLVGTSLAKRGPEAGIDLDRGFNVLASQDMSTEAWWRLDPQTGRADARFAFAGNARPFFPKPGDGAVRSGVSSAAEHAAERAKDLRKFNKETVRQINEHLKRQKVAEAEADALRKQPTGGTEYTILTKYVSLTISKKLGNGVGIALIIGIAYAIYG